MAPMKATGSGLGRALRWFVLLLFAGGVALAVETSCIGSFAGGVVSSVGCVSSFSWEEKPVAAMAPAATTNHSSQFSLSRNALLPRHLFARPATGWRLDRLQEESTSASRSEQRPPIIAEGNNPYFVSPT